MANYLSIDEFVSNSFMRYGGLLKPNTFKIELKIPEGLKISNGKFKGYSGTEGIFTWNAISVSSPGFTIQDSEQFPYRTRLVQRSLDNLSIQFFENNGQFMNLFFYSWMNLMIDHRNNSNRIDRVYESEWASELKIFNLNEKNGTKHSVHETFSEVYPISAGAINYDIGDENSYVRYPVTFKYRYHNVDQTK